MNKFLRGILVFLVLVVAPVGSWYYLKSGFSYQKQVRDELNQFGTLHENLFEAPKDSSIFLLAFIEQQEAIKKLYQQFGATEHFQVMLLNGGDSLVLDELTIYSEPQQRLIKKMLEPSLEQRKQASLNAQFSADDINLEEPEFFALLDTSFVVRGIYDATKEEHIKRMIEHIAILLPYKYKRRGE